MDPDKKTTSHLDFLDVLRGVAILWVFLFHSIGMSYGHGEPQWGRGWVRDFAGATAPGILFPLFDGWLGVAVFFVVSGFCIHLSYLRGRPGDWRGFFARRFFRIYPPYLAALCLFAFLFPKTQLAWHPFAWGQLLSHLFLVHNFRSDWFFGINGSFWTIAVEVQLYLLYPVLLALVARIGWTRALCILGVLEGVLRAWKGGMEFLGPHPLPSWFSGLPFYFWFSWAVGAAVADAYVRGEVLPFGSWPVWPWVALALVAPAVKGLADYAFPIMALATASALSRRLGGQGPMLPWLPDALTAHLRRLGVWSYAVYLLHQPVILLVPYAHLKIHVPPALQIPLVSFAVCLGLYPLIVAASALFRRQVELPSIAWGKWFLHRAT